MRIILFFFLLMTYAAISLGQKPKYVYQFLEEERLDEKRLVKWEPKNPNGYNGIYHFGDSEGEWDLVVIASDSTVILQSYSNLWGKVDNIKEETWLKECRTYKGGKLISNKFSSDGLLGFFMNYKDDGITNGIILPSRNGKIDTVEFGARQKLTFKDYFEGDYPELSFQIVDDDYFSGKTKEQLQIMRNEIFARYGKRFAKNGKMYNHFIKTKWYRPWRENVEDCLTEIEKRNIERIIIIEKE